MAWRHYGVLNYMCFVRLALGVHVHRLNFELTDNGVRPALRHTASFRKTPFIAVRKKWFDAFLLRDPLESFVWSSSGLQSPSSDPLLTCVVFLGEYVVMIAMRMARSRGVSTAARLWYVRTLSRERSRYRGALAMLKVQQAMVRPSQSSYDPQPPL